MATDQRWVEVGDRLREMLAEPPGRKDYAYRTRLDTVLGAIIASAERGTITAFVAIRDTIGGKPPTAQAVTRAPIQVILEEGLAAASGEEIAAVEAALAETRETYDDDEDP